MWSYLWNRRTIHDPCSGIWYNYGLSGHVANLTSSQQRHEVTFTASNVTSTNGRLRIKFSSVDDFYFDNVSLAPVSVAAASEGRAASGALHQTQQPGRVYLPLVASQEEPGEVEAAAVDATIITKYYYFGAQRVAMATDNPNLAAFRYLHWDHLGSTIAETNTSGIVMHEQGYYAFGADRDVDAGDGKSDTVITEHKFTGQKLDGSGLMYYNARYYDPAIGQFVSPDTIVPDPENVLAYNRYMYTLGNPLKYSDPSGYYSVEELQQHFGVESFDEFAAIFGEGGEHEGLWGWYDILRAANDGDTVAAWNPNGMAPISGVFGRDASGSIMINMDGEQIVGAATFANYGGYSKGANTEGWGLEYGAYASNSAGFASHMMKPAMSGGQFGADASSGCRVWDCKALYYDTMSLGGSFIGDTPTPITVVGGKALDLAATGAGLAHTREQYLKGNATRADLTVNSVTAVGSVIPGIGEAAGIVQIAWDILDPFHPY